MDIIVWIVTGAAVGWIAYSYLGMNESRGRIMSMVIGAIGAIVGGTTLAPIFVVAPLDKVSVSSMAFAAGAAAALLLVGNIVQNRWDV